MARRGTLLAYVRAHQTLDQPLVPGSWEVMQGDSRWASVWPLGRTANPDTFFHCWMAIRRAGFTPHRGLFVCTGAPSVLQALADRIAADALPWTLTWPSLAAFRADATASVVTLRGEYPDERPPGGVPLVALWSRMAGWLDDDGEGA